MDLGRWLRHLVSGPWSVGRAFPASAMAAIEASIRTTEATHLGEIVFAVQSALDCAAPDARRERARAGGRGLL